MPDRAWWYTTWDRSEYDRQRYEAWKARLIELLGGKCAKCESTEDLQFDHVSRELKEFAIMKRWNRSETELQEELNKCQLLCGPHHKEKTASEVRNPHGGGLTGIKGCSCDLCHERRNQYSRDRKRRIRQQNKEHAGDADGRSPDSKPVK